MVQHRLNLASLDHLVQDPASEVTFVEMSGPLRVERCPLAFLSGSNLDKFCLAYFRPTATFSPRGYYRLRNASIIADGIVVQGSNLMTGKSIMMADGFFPSIWTSPAFHDFDGATIGAHIPDSRHWLPGRTVSLISLGWQIYGHMLLDVLPRIERIIRSGVHFDRFLLGAPQPWHEELVSLAGIRERQIVYVDNNWTAIDCEELLLPVIDRSDTELHPDILSLYQRITRDRVDKKSDQNDIFISRNKWGGTRSLINRANIEDIARDAGFTIVSPETMPLAEQVALFASARSILGESGSGMHATLFSGRGVKVGVIQTWEHTNFLQSQIGALAGQSVGYALGEPTEDGSWTVDGDAVARLADFLVS